MSDPASDDPPFEINVARRVQRLPPYLFGRINTMLYNKRRAGDDVIDLGMGNPSGPPEEMVIDKLIEASRDEKNHGYSKSNGIANLRREVASKYVKQYGVRLDPDREVIVCLGSKEGFSHMCLAMMGSGDTAIVPAPYFPIHVYSVALASANVISLEVASSDKFLSDIAYTCETLYPRPKLLILNYPHNPSTVVVDQTFYDEIVKLARRFGFMVISDFAYADVGYDGYKPPSFLASPGATEVGVEFTTMSKGYNMAGWRIGYCCGNARMIEALATIKGYYDYGMFQAIQIAAIVALRHTDAAVERQSRIYQGRRDTLCHALARAGWSHATQGGHVPVGADPRAVARANEHDGLCHDAAGARQRGGQPGKWFRPGGRRFPADVVGGKRSKASAGGSSDQSLFTRSGVALMRRMMTFFLGMVVGGGLLYTAEHYHLVRARDGFHMIPKTESTWAATYVDIRNFSPADWARHADVAMAITTAKQGKLLENSATQSLQEGVQELFHRGESSR